MDLGYLLKIQNFGICFKTHEPDFSDCESIEQDWFFIHGDVQGSLLTNAPEPLGKSMQLVHHVDANLIHDALTGGSIAAFSCFINLTPIDWFSEKQSMVETATHSSEFVATGTCVKQVIDLHTTL